MTVNYPTLAGLMAVLSVYIMYVTLGGTVSHWHEYVAASAVFLVAAALWMYLPLPQTNGGAMGSNTERYWGFTKSDE